MIWVILAVRRALARGVTGGWLPSWDGDSGEGIVVLWYRCSQLSQLPKACGPHCLAGQALSSVLTKVSGSERCTTRLRPAPRFSYTSTD